MMTYIAIIDVRYPTTLAICFLKEIQNEFSGKYDAREIAKMKRPYSCIEFSKFHRSKKIVSKSNCIV
jgi:hypothetical protein